jgi:hypothetical protein
MAYVPRASPVTADASTDVSAQTQSAAWSGEVSPAEVLITEQEVRLGTAAAVPLRRREKIARRLVAMLQHRVVTFTNASHPRRSHLKRREPHYFERARMGREMDRL